VGAPKIHDRSILYIYQQAYAYSKFYAKCKGIGFQLTVKEWVDWWEAQLGPNWFQLRGRGSDQYCMARFGDKGPYALWNIKCITAHNNIAERKSPRGSAHPHSKLTENQVALIIRSSEPTKVLARRYRVSDQNIWMIRTGKAWKHCPRPKII
jgi:hypothetical protein